MGNNQQHGDAKKLTQSLALILAQVAKTGGKKRGSTSRTGLVGPITKRRIFIFKKLKVKGPRADVVKHGQGMSKRKVAVGRYHAQGDL